MNELSNRARHDRSRRINQRADNFRKTILTGVNRNHSGHLYFKAAGKKIWIDTLARENILYENREKI